MTERRVHTWLSDMDGVPVHEEQAIPGAADFLDALKATGLAEGGTLGGRGGGGDVRS